jgi:rSAM/selenodomain-associated transferase 1
MARTPDTLICVFAKEPQAGAVKTRLIPLLGPQGAADFHARCVRHALETALDADLGPATLCCSPDSGAAFFARCAEDFGVALIEQGNGNLGERMHRALEYGLSKHESVILFGADCPALQAQDIREAAQALRGDYDAALSPAEDGGYVLIGTRRADRRLFDNVTWSSPRVMQQTRDNLHEMRWRWKELALQWDIDRPADYHRLKASTLMDI